jgi:hypothetical protein
MTRWASFSGPKRVKDIRDGLECGMDRAGQIERAERLVDWIDHARETRSMDDLANAIREVVLDQYGVRNFDFERIA